jgi:hypothetical protein
MRNGSVRDASVQNALKGVTVKLCWRLDNSDSETAAMHLAALACLSACVIGTFAVKDISIDFQKL